MGDIYYLSKALRFISFIWQNLLKGFFTIPVIIISLNFGVSISILLIYSIHNFIVKPELSLFGTLQVGLAWVVANFPIVRCFSRLYPYQLQNTYGRNIASLLVGLSFYLLWIINLTTLKNLTFSILLVAISLLYIYFAYNQTYRRIPSSYYLFLRRFASRSEFDFFPLVSKSMPRKERLIMLIEHGLKIDAWNIFAISFGRLTSPHLIPTLYLQSNDEQWIKYANILIDRAEVVIFDVTELSDSIETEILIIKEKGREYDVIWLTSNSSESCRNLLKKYDIHPTIGRIISSCMATKVRTKLQLYFGYIIWLFILFPLIPIADSIQVSPLLIHILAIFLAIRFYWKPRITGYWKSRIIDRIREEANMIRSSSPVG